MFWAKLRTEKCISYSKESCTCPASSHVIYICVSFNNNQTFYLRIGATDFFFVRCNEKELTLKRVQNAIKWGIFHVFGLQLIRLV